MKPAPHPAILGIGSATPSFSLTQQEAAELVRSFGPPDGKSGRLLQALYKKTRVEKRGSVLLENSEAGQSFFPPGDGSSPGTRERMERYAAEAPELGRRAAREALSESGVDAGAITHLVTVSCTGFRAPGFDVSLVKSLGLSASVERTHVGFMGCHGALNGLRAARAFAAASPGARVLLCAVELCSLHLQYGPQSRASVANSLFADGAAACVVGPASAAREGDWRLAASGSAIFPDSEDAMTWEIGDHGFEMTLSKEVPALIAAHLPSWFERWLGESGLGAESVRSWALHPGGPKILEAVAQSLRLPSGAARVSEEILASRGNMSSPTILFILREMMRGNAPGPRAALAFGPGLTVEAALFL